MQAENHNTGCACPHCVWFVKRVAPLEGPAYGIVNIVRGTNLGFAFIVHEHIQIPLSLN